MKLYTLRCSQCKTAVRATSRTEGLQRMRRHQWKEHRAWLITKIKAGQRRRSERPGVQTVLQGILQKDVGNPSIALPDRRQWALIETIINLVLPYLPPDIQGYWRAIQSTRRALDITKLRRHTRRQKGG